MGSVDGSFGAIAADGSYVYAVSNYGLAVISVSDPTTPAQVGFLPLNATITSVAKSGSFVYVMSYAGLFAIDVSNPLAPTQVGLYEGARDGSIEANGPLVTINAGSVQIVDFSNPTTPRVVGNFAGYASDWPKAGASVTKGYLVYRPANRDGLMIMRSRQATHAQFLPVAPHNR